MNPSQEMYPADPFPRNSTRARRRRPPVQRARVEEHTERARPWPWVSWWFSLLFVIPVTIIAVMTSQSLVAGPATVTLRVADAVSERAVAGARVVAGDVVATTSAEGEARFEVPKVGTVPVVIDAPGYYNGASALVADNRDPLAVTMRSSTVRGTIIDAASGEPMAGVQVTARQPDGNGDGAPTTLTAADGMFELRDVPDNAEIVATLDGFGTLVEAFPNGSPLALSLRAARVTGRVLDAAGEPIPNAIVSAGTINTVTQRDGTYVIDDALNATEITVIASGFVDGTAAITPERTVELALDRVMIKAAYINQFGLIDPEKIERMIALIERTELNALVLDIKQDTIYYDSQVPFFRAIPNMVVPLYDVRGVLDDLRDRGIYSIARMVVFQDPLVARGRPDLAVKDDITGGTWMNYDNVGWVNAFHEELWDANIELALEAAALGFDEVQYDYVRFPSDGDLRTADFGREYTAEARAAAITGFIARSSERLRPTGIKLAVDLFGWNTMVYDDQGIGQVFTEIAPLVDYICMMNYPSHFTTGNIASAPGHPNEYPYETILESLQRADQIAPGNALKFRPWLQDFSHPISGFSPYGADEVRAQIDAAEEFGASGWLLWNPANNPTEAALKPA